MRPAGRALVMSWLVAVGRSATARTGDGAAGGGWAGRHGVGGWFQMALPRGRVHLACLHGWPVLGLAGGVIFEGVG